MKISDKPPTVWKTREKHLTSNINFEAALEHETTDWDIWLLLCMGSSSRGRRSSPRNNYRIHLVIRLPKALHPATFWPHWPCFPYEIDGGFPMGFSYEKWSQLGIRMVTMYVTMPWVEATWAHQPHSSQKVQRGAMDHPHSERIGSNAEFVKSSGWSFEQEIMSIY